jgi:broad specificity phosphatase PhoE
MERTVESAKLVATTLSIGAKEIQFDDRIIEATNAFKGLPITFKTVMSNDNWTKALNPFKPSWGESYFNTAIRMVDFVFDTATKFPRYHVIALSHESPIYVLRRRFSGQHLWHNMATRHTNYASITTMIFDDNANDVVKILYADPAARLLPTAQEPVTHWG